MTKQYQEIQEWLNQPITKNYLRYLQEKEKFAIRQAELIVANAIENGELTRTPKEISIFNQIKDYRTTYSDLLYVFNLSQKDELAEHEKLELVEFYNNLIK
jgi:hypothetical protein